MIGRVQVEKLFSSRRGDKVPQENSQPEVSLGESRKGESTDPEQHLQQSNSSVPPTVDIPLIKSDKRGENEGREGSAKRLMVLDVAIDIMSILKEASEASSVLNPLKIVSGISLKLLETARGNVTNLLAFESLVEKVKVHNQLLEVEVRKIETRESTDLASQDYEKEAFLTALRAYLQTLERIRQMITARIQMSGTMESMVQSVRDVNSVKELSSLLDESFQRFMRELQTQLLLAVVANSDEALQLRVTQLLGNAVNASGDRVASLMPGTREALIQRLNTWAHSIGGDKPIFWLHDEAGTGKSTLVAYMSEIWRKEDILAGRFFFNKDNRLEYRSLRRFCNTLAREMTTHHPYSKSFLLSSMEENADITSLPFQEQFRALVTSIAEKTSKKLLAPLIFVIDALDECDEEDAQLLDHSILAEVVTITHVRFLLASRSTMELETVLHQNDNVDGVDAMLLDVKHGKAKRDYDTSIYIRHELREFPVEDQEIVIKCAKGVFLWAMLACDALKRSSTPKGTIRKLQSDAPNGRLASLYTAVLDTSLPRDSSQHDLKLLRTVLQGVTLAYTPISIYSVQSFYPENKDERVAGEEYVQLYVKRLGSVMKDGTPYLPIYLLHPTFRKFIENQMSGAKFYIAPFQGHHSIAIACLDMLNTLSPDPFGVMRLEVPLPTWRLNSLGADKPLSRGEDAPLRYAITFWTWHASLALQESEYLKHKLVAFFESTLLTWIEWSSAIGENSECIEGLRSLRRQVRTVSLLGLPNVDDTVERWCIDALRFILKNSYILESCGIQAWMSCLAFTPKSSLVYRAFLHKSLRPVPSLLTEHNEVFDEHRVLTRSPTSVLHVSFSPNGQRFFSFSKGVAFFLWSTKEAKPIRELTEYGGGVLSAAFSEDGSLIVSGGSDETVYLWDGFTGILKMKFPHRHDSVINAVVFALSDSTVVSLPLSGDIIRWEIKGEIEDLHPTRMQGEKHTGSMLGLVRSFDGTLVASFSDDKTVRLWQVSETIGLGKPMEGPDSVLSGSFSTKNTKFIAGYENGVIIVWDITTQEPLHRFEEDTKSIYTIVSSPDGRLVAASGSKFCLYDIEAGQLAYPPLTGHSKSVWGVAFSKSGKRMVSGSYDKTIRVWDFRNACTGNTLDSFVLRGHTRYIEHIAVTPDGRLIASASGDGTLRLWDTDVIDTGDHSFANDHIHDRTKHLALSQDKKRLLSAGHDGTLQMWDFTTGQKIGGLLRSGQKTVKCVAFSQCATLWASGYWNGSVCFWTIRESKDAPVQHTLIGHTGPVQCVTFDHDGTYIASGSDDQFVMLWKVEDRSCAAKFDSSKFISCVAFSPDGRLMAMLSREDLKIWDIASHSLTGEPISVSRPSRQEWRDSMLFSPDSTALVTSQQDNLALYDVEEARCYAFMNEHQQFYNSETRPSPVPVFSSNGKYLFYGSHSFDFSNLSRIGTRADFPPQAAEATVYDPVSPLYLVEKESQIYSRRWKEAILRIPPDINVERAPWVAFKDTIAFGSLEGRVFILRFQEEYL